jgi:hypothetical protein
MADNDQITDQQFLARRWKAHRALVRLETGVVGNHPVFLLIDHSEQPPSFHMLRSDERKGLMAVRGDFATVQQTQGDFVAVAELIIQGNIPSRNIPFAEAIRLFGLAGEDCGLVERSIRRFSEGLGDDALVARLPKADLLKSELTRFKTALMPLVAEFNQEALNALATVEEASWKDYQFYAEKGDKGLFRRQAATTFPLLASFMVSRPSLRLAIDGQKPLLEVLQKAFGRKVPDDTVISLIRDMRDASRISPQRLQEMITETSRLWGISANCLASFPERYKSMKSDDIAQVRSMQETKGGELPEDMRPLLTKGHLNRIRGCAWPTNGIAVNQLVYAVASLPPDWFPKDRENWDAFCDLIATVGGTLRQASGLSLETLFQGCAGKWADFKVRMAHASTDTRPPEGVAEIDEPRLKAVIPWSLLEKLPKEKIRAAARKIASTLETMPEDFLNAEQRGALPPHQVLPTGVSREAVENWICRLYAPDVSRDFLNAACIDAEFMLDAFARKIVLPLAMNEAGVEDVPISSVHYGQAVEAAASVLFTGKSAINIIESVRHFQSRRTLIMAAGNPNAEDNAKQVTEAEARRLHEENIRRKRSEGIKAIMSIPQEIPENGWEPLCDIIKAPNEVYIVPLTSQNLLMDEGRGMTRVGHYADDPAVCVNADGTMGLNMCVGINGYDDMCRNRGYHMFSLRRLTEDGKSFRRLSCVCFNPVGVDHSLKVHQHYGSQNKTPSDDSKRALEWFQEAVISGNIALNLEGVNSRIRRSKSTDEIKNICGYDWRNRQAILAAMTPWGTYVGKKYRKMGVDEFGREAGIMKTALLIEPGYIEARRHLAELGNALAPRV